MLQLFLFLAGAVFWFSSTTVKAEVTGLDHLQDISVTNCKGESDEKPHTTPVGPLCSYSHRLCDVADGKKTILQGVYIDVDCVPKETSCPKLGECARTKLPEKYVDYVRGMSDPNNSSSSPDGAGLDSGLSRQMKSGSP